jgi:hypothetical protein
MNMKPRNFPGRENDRRKGALARLKPSAAFNPEKAKQEQSVLKSRIIPDSMARDIRTKIDRSARGKLRV